MKEELKIFLDGKGLKSYKDFSLSCVSVYKGKMLPIFTYGKNYKFYDLASLTKPLVVGSYFIKNPEHLRRKISDVLPWLGSSKMKIFDLVNHQSGLVAHRKFYQKLNALSPEERSFDLKRFLREEFRKIKPRDRQEIVYSDLGYMILGFAVEALEEKKLSQNLDCLNFKNTFHYTDFKRKGLYAPTEFCEWRHRKIQAEVFDDNASVLSDLLGHAGLFGSIEDMSSYGMWLRKNHLQNPSYFKKSNEAWAHGFMIPTGGENSTAGKHFSKKSIGHLGFTGTSFWYDPEVDLYISVLSNRTYPDRNALEFNSVRSGVQNIIYENLLP